VSGLFAGIYARGDAAACVSAGRWLAAMLEVEAALARACAAEGLIPPDAAERIAAACEPSGFDLDELAREAARHATPVIPLVAALRSRLPAEDGPCVHLGATSQDVLDTAMMLIASRALGLLLEDARAAAAAAAALAERHRLTAMTGRTLLQQALPVSFGLRAAGWLAGLAEAIAALERVRAGGLAVQMGGPVGSRSPAVAARVAAGLGLAEPPLPWHTERVRVASLAGALGSLCGVLGKIARDVTLLAQNEIGEVREGGDPDRGGSSAMAHKRNPAGAVSVLACTRRAPGLAATLLAAMEQEHERAAGAWQAEWGTLSELLALAASAAAWGRELLERLEVDPGRMAANLAALAAAGVAEAAEPGRHLGAAEELIDRALAASRALIPSRAQIPSGAQARS
jgi:3-carboxy-cis,cis-muconate cycloisomerase